MLVHPLGVLNMFTQVACTREKEKKVVSETAKMEVMTTMETISNHHPIHRTPLLWYYPISLSDGQSCMRIKKKQKTDVEF